MGIFTWLFGSADAKIVKIEKQATALKKENPDEAVQLLKKSEKMRQKNGMEATSTKLRMATVLYQAKRFDEAEAILLAEYAEARKWVIGKREFDYANKMYHERIAFAKKYNGELKDFERKRDGGENADFNRNLYCLRIYAKLRTCYERAKQFEKALPFAVAEAYAKYENRYHNAYCDDPQPDFKAVEKCIAKIGDPELMQAVQAVFAKYAAKPDSTKCWRMIDELQKM